MKRIILTTAVLCSTTLWAGFDFGECSGFGTFAQHIDAYGGDKEHAVTVGTIPEGIEGLEINLASDADVDIRLYGEDEDKVVHWPDGILHKGSAETKPYKGVNVTYSGYDGVGGKKGHEYIKVEAPTPTELIMKAFGYQEGDAVVNYIWTGKEGCEEDKGSGHFTQEIPKKDITLVGDIPKGIMDFTVSLKSDKDIDIQLYGEDGTAIIAWPEGLLHGASKDTITYHGMEIEWSGFFGTNGKPGHEYITITGETTEQVTMKVYGYQAGSAQVDYSWGETKGFNIMTYNIRHYTPCDEGKLHWTNRKKYVLDNILNNDIDILGLQEMSNVAESVEECNKTGGYGNDTLIQDDINKSSQEGIVINPPKHMLRDWMRESLKKKGYKALYKASGSPKAIFINTNIFHQKETNYETLGQFHYEADSVRSATWAIIEHNDNNQSYFIVNTHLTSHTGHGEERLSEIRELKENITKNNPRNYPVIIMGDMNFVSCHQDVNVTSQYYNGECLHDTLLSDDKMKNKYNDAYVYTGKDGTLNYFDKKESKYKIDYIINDKRLEIDQQSPKIITTKYHVDNNMSIFASDHHPYMLHVNLGIDTDLDGIKDTKDLDDDNDGKNDIDEGIVDTDGDGIIDALESNISDADHDGVCDEKDSENTNPYNDSDGDGYSNIYEQKEGADPLNSTSIPKLIGTNDNNITLNPNPKGQALKIHFS